METSTQNILETYKILEELESLKYVHYRDLIDWIDETNYQICTKVDYKAVENTNGNIRETWGRLQFQFKNQIRNSHISPRSKSQYFVTLDGDVYRFSDHWGIVKTCIWTREGQGNMIASLKVYGDWEIGKANLSEFRVVRYQDRKADYVINPLWIEKIQPHIEFLKLVPSFIKSDDFKLLSNENKQMVGQKFKYIKSVLIDFQNYQPIKK